MALFNPTLLHFQNSDVAQPYWMCRKPGVLRGVSPFSSMDEKKKRMSLARDEDGHVRVGAVSIPQNR